MIHLFSTRTASGVLYELDMRLRPSGNAGLMVTPSTPTAITSRKMPGPGNTRPWCAVA
ncbi:hypothetical protein MBH78_02480 [Oceanimonas sp. NS1]|nr:hypothetical protein [Oceanimonas sp. NS1]